MTKDTRDTAALGILIMIGTTWIAYVAYSIWQQRQMDKRATDTLARLAEAGTRKRGGDGAAIAVPAPSSN